MCTAMGRTDGSWEAVQPRELSSGLGEECDYRLPSSKPAFSQPGLS